MTTVLGKPVSQVKVTLVSARCIGADAPVWSSQVFLPPVLSFPAKNTLDLLYSHECMQYNDAGSKALVHQTTLGLCFALMCLSHLLVDIILAMIWVVGSSPPHELPTT